MSKASAASKIGKKAIKKGKPAIRKSIDLLKENEEEIREVHEVLEETGAYEKMLEKGLSKLESGEGSRDLVKKFENKEMEELKEFEEAIREIEDVIQGEEKIYEYAGKVVKMIANVEEAEEAEEQDVENHIQQFENTRDAKHLETAFEEELDAIKTVHEEAELATQAAEVIDQAAGQVLELEQLEEMEGKEAREQEKIFQEEGQFFMKMGGQKDFLSEVQQDEQTEEQQILQEEQQTEKVVKLEKEEIQKLEDELARMLEEAKRNRQDLMEIKEDYEQFPVEFQDEDQIPQRIQEAEQMIEQDIENIEGALKMLRNDAEAEESQAESELSDIQDIDQELR
jgi:hypothetical protein